MTAICYSGIISVILTIRLREKKTWAKFHNDISKTEGVVRVYTDGQTDGQG